MYTFVDGRVLAQQFRQCGIKHGTVEWTFDATPQLLLLSQFRLLDARTRTQAENASAARGSEYSFKNHLFLCCCCCSSSFPSHPHSLVIHSLAHSLTHSRNHSLTHSATFSAAARSMIIKLVARSLAIRIIHRPVAASRARAWPVTYSYSR